MAGWSSERFAVLAPGQTDAEIAALTQVLDPKNAHGARVVKDLRDAVQSKAEVLVLFLAAPAAQPVKYDPSDVAALKTMKVIGIGHEAAGLYHKLGLEISDGAMAHGPSDQKVSIEVAKNKLTPQHAGKSFVASELPGRGPGEGMGDMFQMHLPAYSEVNRFVEGIAYRVGDPKYASIARQGNHVIVGITAPAPTWTPEYKSLFRELANSLAEAPKLPFQRPAWEKTEPGTYDLELTRDGSPAEQSSKTFYFQFGNPGVFTATLEHEGSAAMMLFFRGPNGQQAARRDARGEAAGKQLRIVATLETKDIDQTKDDFWTLKVTNFDRKNGAKCRVRIAY